MKKNYILPKIVDKGELELLHFPTRMQAFVFRNWEIVPAKKIAEVLNTSEENVKAIAYQMGLDEQGDVSVWLKKGYITIIKQNWHILPYEQLLLLLGWTEDKLAYILREDDYLSHKMGDFKPLCEKVEYKPLTKEQAAETEKLKQNVLALKKERERNAFEFFEAPQKKTAVGVTDGVSLTDGWGILNNTDFGISENFIKRFKSDVKATWDINLCGSEKFIVIEKTEGEEESHSISVTEQSVTIRAVDCAGALRGLFWILDKMDERNSPSLPICETERTARFKNRIIYSYHGLYGNVFDEDIEISFTDELLYNYARLGVNAVWTQGVLYKLTPFPFDESLSEGYKERIEKLRELVSRAAKYGIKVYLYLNEPRAMPHVFFEKYPHLKGDKEGDYSALCTSTPEVKEYLYNAVQALCRSVPGLGGFITITASENLTNCYSRVWENPTRCPRCKERTPASVFSEVNRIIYDAATSVSPSIHIIVWSWGWKLMLGHNDEECISRLPKGVSVMSVSEEDIHFEIGGIKGEVLDYSMSIVGPGERAKNIWSLASKYGCGTAVKVQINNSWECSTVPYIPTFGLVCQHIENLSQLGVNDLMLSWTLGGAPSPNIKMASQYFFNEDGLKSDMLSVTYGENRDLVEKATQKFDEAFKEFPFHIDTLYYGPQFSGPANLLYKEKSGYEATMTGIPFDDVKLWCGPYTKEVLENQFKKLSVKWKDGLDALEPMKGTELYDVSAACYALFRSSYNQTKYVRLREEGNKAEILELLQEEEKLSRLLYEISLRQPTIGYEAANHYVYTPGMCLERILNCKKLIEEWA